MIFVQRDSAEFKLNICFFGLFRNVSRLRDRTCQNCLFFSCSQIINSLEFFSPSRQWPFERLAESLEFNPDFLLKSSRVGNLTNDRIDARWAYLLEK